MTESAGGLAAALVRALGEMGDVARSGTVTMQGRKDRKYPTLADVRTVSGPALHKHGLCLVQDVVTDGDWVRVTTTIVHSSGERMTFGPICRPAGRDVQQLGSEITYVRRYGWLAALGLAGEDDDGESAKDSKAQTGGGGSSRPVSPARADRDAPPPPEDVPAPPHPRGRARDGASPPGGSGVPSGSAQARQAKAAEGLVAAAEMWRDRVVALPASSFQKAALRMVTDLWGSADATPTGQQALELLDAVKKGWEARLVLAEADAAPDVEREPFDDGPPLDD
jgi:hypothetical protein